MVNEHPESCDSSAEILKGENSLGGAPLDTTDSQSQLGEVDFLRCLFLALEQEDVRYCVLQRWDALMEELHTDHDVDLAVHPKDAAKLPFVWLALRERGYQPIQLLNHAVNSYAFVFAWFENLNLRTVMVDIAFEHRQSGLIWKSGEELVAGRRKQGDLWVSDPGVELAYLLVKKMLKGTFKASREQRYKLLVERAGRPQAEKIISDLFGEGKKRQVIEACEQADLGPVLRPLRKSFLAKRFVRNPLNLVRYLVADGLRLGRRWFQPTGVSLALLGTSGVRESNISERVVDVLTPAFGAQKVEWRRRAKTESKEGGAARWKKNSHRAVGSTINLFAWFGNLWLGYAFRIRPLVARTYLVVFDRYFPDGLVDGNSSTYRGPMWLARLLSHLVPKPDLLLFLDAREDREEGAAPAEHAAARNSSRTGADPSREIVQFFPGAVRVGNNPKTDQTVREASQLFLDHLAQRFQNRHARWLGLQS